MTGQPCPCWIEARPHGGHCCFTHHSRDDGRPVPCGHDTAGGALRDAHLAAHPQDESLF